MMGHKPACLKLGRGARRERPYNGRVTPKGSEMANTNLVRGLFLMAVALFFASNALRYPVGDMARSGAGMLAVPLYFNIKNIALILGSLVLFFVASRFVNMLLGIVLMVFVVGFAAQTYSWKRNVQISIGLTAVALIFERILGLNLRLI